MTSKKEYLEYVLEQLSNLSTITYRPMMGEYLLYNDGILFGGIYDCRLLIKKTATNEKFNLPEEIPYKNAKIMYFIEDLEDKEKVAEIIAETCLGLKK